ncbi:hypothetical protein E9232_002805 [Inquilinus ginsengisoli]|uniref:Uncharacterized protein n=1 Tax=Inquilinus ginsengisoli TaxID=363840 RepID=A0ABU1JRU2_9PROT|nr:hypothetical protein [Inquilinus ginsengisoli]MDR6290284.1 hypothetical protein [Inquilinus ginsengisoli]
MQALWPWLAVAGMGAWHGLNPATGWALAAALGLRHRGAVPRALVPIAIGHVLSIAVVAGAVATAGLVVDPAWPLSLAAVALLGWAALHRIRGVRQQPPPGLEAGLAGLTLWSFLMATAHGAGLMLVPALVPICLSGSAMGSLTASLGLALAAIALHTAAMLAVTGLVAAGVARGIGGLLGRWVGRAARPAR